MAITKFYDLASPMSDHGNGVTDWYVRNGGSESYYLLNYIKGGNYTISDLMMHQDKDFYFSTEVKAHSYAAGYYLRYGIKYPYYTEWDAAILKEAVKNGAAAIVAGSTDVKSEPMEFE